MINYFNSDDETMGWIASHVFSDIHFGGPMSEAEYENRKKIMEDYKVEIEEVKEILLSKPEFNSWDYERQINYVANMLVDLKHNKQQIENRAFLMGQAMVETPEDVLFPSEEELASICEGYKGKSK